MKKILLGEISSYKAIVIARYLKYIYSGIDIIAYDYKNIIQCCHTKYCDDYLCVPDAYLYKDEHINFIKDILRNQYIDIFIPVHSHMYAEYIKNKAHFGKAFDYVGEYEKFNMLNDKKNLNELLAKLDIKRPKTYDLYEAAKVPFIMKPTNLSSAKGVKYVLNENDRSRYQYQYNNDLIIQEYISGVGCGYSVFAKNGEIKVGFGHKRLAEYPVAGGSSVYRETHFDHRTRDLAQKILRATQWTGFAMFEFKLTDENEIYVIEVNPRIWGSINQGLQNGYNYFEPILGKSEFRADQKIQYKTYLSPLIYLSFLNYLLRLNTRPVTGFLKNIRVNRADVSFLDDYKGFISLIARKI